MHLHLAVEDQKRVVEQVEQFTTQSEPAPN